MPPYHLNGRGCPLERSCRWSWNRTVGCQAIGYDPIFVSLRFWGRIMHKICLMAVLHCSTLMNSWLCHIMSIQCVFVLMNNSRYFDFPSLQVGGNLMMKAIASSPDSTTQATLPSFSWVQQFVLVVSLMACQGAFGPTQATRCSPWIVTM